MMLTTTKFLTLADSVGEQKRVIESAMDQAKTGLSNNKNDIAMLDDFGDTETLLPAIRTVSDRYATNNFQITGLTPIAIALFNNVGGNSFLADNDIRVTEDFADLLEYLGRPVDTLNIMPPVHDPMATIDFTGAGAADVTLGDQITDYGKAELEAYLPADFGTSSADLDITVQKEDGSTETVTITIGASDPADTTYAIGTGMYVAVTDVTVASGGSSGDQVEIRSILERDATL